MYVDCKCGKKYVGEASMKVATRMQQHRKSIKDKKWDLSGISNHAKYCKQGFDWTNDRTIKIEEKKKLIGGYEKH